MTSAPQLRTINERLRLAARQWPAHTAVIDGHQSITYADLYAEAQAYARAFRFAGLRSCDKVLLMLPTNRAYVSIWLGCMLAGIHEVPVNTDLTGETLKHILVDSQAVAVVTCCDLLERFDRLDSLGLLRTILLVDQAGGFVRGIPTLKFEPAATSDALAVALDFEPAEDTVVGILYTSGTTGPSKGAVITHRQAFEYAHLVGSALKLRPGDVYYGPLPLFHIAGQWAVVYASIIFGATAQIRGRFSLSSFWDDCRASGATVSYLLGSMAQLVANAKPTQDDRRNTLQRMLMIPLVSTLQAFRERFDLEVTTCYGSTEVGVPIAADYDVQDPTIIGRGVKGYDLRVVGESGEDAPPGAVGELYVRAPEKDLIFREYFGNKEATAKAFTDGWFHTGDLVRCDAAGNFRFVDRSKDALRRRGENISAFEVEREFYAHPAVFECAAVGVPSRLTEDDLVVCIVLKPGARDVSGAELMTFVRERAPRFMWPDRVLILSEIPKTPTGKIAKHILRAQVVQNPQSATKPSESL